MKRLFILSIGLLGMGATLLAQDSGGPMTLRLAAKSIRHAQVFDARDIVVTEGTAIDEAVMVKFHACDKIVFGEGFHLAPGAEMVATVEESCKDGGEAAQGLDLSASSITIGPNPFTDRTTAIVELSAAAVVNLQIYDLGGRMVSEPLPGANLEAGAHQIRLDLSDLPSGSYFYRAQLGEVQKTGKLVRLE